MDVKPFLLSIAMLCLSVSVFAQDKIYKNNGDVIDAQVKEVNAQTITFKRYDNPAGPDYIVNKDEVERIKYQNGTEDTFNDDESFRRHRPMPPHMRHIKKPDMHYGKNVFAAAPLQFSENGIGFGLTYERTLDRNGIISFYLPAYLTFNPNNDNGYNNSSSNSMFYVAPGVKVYPTGCYGKIRYAIGPSLVIGTGTTSDYYYNGYYAYYRHQNHFVLGMLVNNSMNINPTPHLYLGLELGIGATYLNEVGGYNQDVAFLMQTAFRIGYRF